MCPKGSFDRWVIIPKGFLKLPNLLMLIKEDYTSQKLGSCNFFGITNGVVKKV